MKRTELKRSTPLTSGGIQRRKRCGICRIMFTPARKSQAVCESVECALAHGKLPESQAKTHKALADIGRKEIEVRKQALKSRSEYMREAQTAFNRFIRLRDKDLPCICCGSYGPGEDWLTGGKWDAGHFLGRGAYPELRFVEDNVHKQLKTCNAGSSKYAAKGRTVAQGYRERLIVKIGLDRVLELEGPHEPKKYTVEQLKAITAEYRAKTRELKKGQAA